MVSTECLVLFPLMFLYHFLGPSCAMFFPQNLKKPLLKVAKTFPKEPYNALFVFSSRSGFP